MSEIDKKTIRSKSRTPRDNNLDADSMVIWISIAMCSQEVSKGTLVHVLGDLMYKYGRRIEKRMKTFMKQGLPYKGYSGLNFMQQPFKESNAKTMGSKSQNFALEFKEKCHD